MARHDLTRFGPQIERISTLDFKYSADTDSGLGAVGVRGKRH